MQHAWPCWRGNHQGFRSPEVWMAAPKRKKKKQEQPGTAWEHPLSNVQRLENLGIKDSVWKCAQRSTKDLAGGPVPCSRTWFPSPCLPRAPKIVCEPGVTSCTLLLGTHGAGTRAGCSQEQSSEGWQLRVQVKKGKSCSLQAAFVQKIKK